MGWASPIQEELLISEVRINQKVESIAILLSTINWMFCGGTKKCVLCRILVKCTMRNVTTLITKRQLAGCKESKKRHPPDVQLDLDPKLPHMEKHSAVWKELYQKNKRTGPVQGQAVFKLCGLAYSNTTDLLFQWLRDKSNTSIPKVCEIFRSR